MLHLICDYTIDPPEVIAWYEDKHLAAVDMTAHPGCVMVPYDDDAFRALPKIGPEPTPPGDAPTARAPGHDELDKAGIPHTIAHPETGEQVTHPLREMAGKVYPDNRRRGWGEPSDHDTRRRLAPDQSEPAVLTAYAAQERWAKEVGGVTVDGFPAYTSRETRGETEAAAGRAARDPKFRKRVKGADGEFRTLDADTLVKVADAVSDHVQACFDAEDRVKQGIADGSIKSLADVDKTFGAP